MYTTLGCNDIGIKTSVPFNISSLGKFAYSLHCTCAGGPIKPGEGIEYIGIFKPYLVIFQANFVPCNDCP